VVKTSAKTEYACLAMIRLAAQFESGELIRVRDIAAAHNIPARFLVQILLQLKGAGLVSSTRGASGGYRLARAPEKISLSQIMTVMEGPRSVGFTSDAADTPEGQALLEIWDTVSRQTQKLLSDVTLEDLMQRARKQSGNMFYI
jgi:Rrf2 family protein